MSVLTGYVDRQWCIIDRDGRWQQADTGNATAHPHHTTPQTRSSSSPRMAASLSCVSCLSVSRLVAPCVRAHPYPTAQGQLKGFDQTTNIILSDSTERVFSADEPVEEVPLGLYLIRGDNM